MVFQTAGIEVATLRFNRWLYHILQLSTFFLYLNLYADFSNAQIYTYIYSASVQVLQIPLYIIKLIAYKVDI